ncbi:MAG: hypothetical protein JWO46_2788 [Nocardioidaceae bacterium]|nr:hypothetical protein [Nocardioidaceae bacterium]
MVEIIRVSVGDVLAILRHAGRLFARHWPVLVALFLLGAIFHDGLLWFCVWLSADHSTLAGFVLPLVPISTLTAMILMLRHLAPDLPHVTPPEAATEPEPEAIAPSGVRGRLARLRSPAQARLTLLASTLIPFLTVYVSQSWLRDDARAFVNAVTFNEFYNTDYFAGESANIDRTFIATGTGLVAIVVGAFVVRWGLGRFDLAKKAVGLGLLAAYVEVLWVFLLAKSFDNYREAVLHWVERRQLTSWLLDAWHWLIDLLGPVGRPVEAVGEYFFGVLGQFDDIIVIPIAWLTVGAVVYGRQLSAKERAESERRARWRARAERVPAPLRRAGSEFGDTVRERFAPLGNGIRLLATAGLPAMLLFCVIFLAAAKVEDLVEWLRQLILGPIDTYDGLAFSPALDVTSRGAYLVVLVVLLGAAVDRILSRAETQGLVAAGEEALVDEAVPVDPASPGGS